MVILTVDLGTCPEASILVYTQKINTYKRNDLTPRIAVPTSMRLASSCVAMPALIERPNEAVREITGILSHLRNCILPSCQISGVEKLQRH
jgi:hypothetical protein